MKSASEHAIQLISPWKKISYKEEILATLFKEDAHFVSLTGRVSELLKHLRHTESIVFRANVIEALFVLHYSEALDVLWALEKAIEADATSHYRVARPAHVHALILGAVRAANWSTNTLVSPAFDKALPAGIARLIGLMGRLELFPKEERYYWPESKDTESLKGSLETYLEAVGFSGDAAAERTRRSKNILKDLNLLDLTDLAMKRSQSIVQEVIHAALNALPLPEQISVLARAHGRKNGEDTSKRLRAYSVVSGVYLDPEHCIKLSIPFAYESDATCFLTYYRSALRADGTKGIEHFDSWGRNAELTNCPVIPVSNSRFDLVVTKLSAEDLRLAGGLVERIARIHSIPLAEIMPPIFGQRHGAVTFEWEIPTKLITE